MLYGNGILLATIKSDTPTPKLYHNHLDHLDSTKAVTTPDGYLNQELEYYPFGQTKVDNQYGNLTQSNQYIGQNFDQETELSYLNARYYDGERGQFLSQDPAFLDIGSREFSQKYERSLKRHLRNPQALNSYSYGLNNPVINKDPEGEIIQLVAVIEGVLTVYNIVDVLVDNYHYNNTKKYPDQYSQGEKNDAYRELVVDAVTFGVGNLFKDQSRRILFDGVTAGSDYIKQFSNIEPVTSSRPSSNSSKPQNNTSKSSPSANKPSSSKGSSSSSVSNKIKTVSYYVSLAEKDMNKGNYKGAKNNLNKAINSLN